MPVSVKMRGLLEKHVLREAMRGLLPEPIRRRRKRGLRAPGHVWLRDRSPEFIAELLSDRSLKSAGYFKPDVVADLLRRHRAGGGYAGLLFGVLGVQYWDETFRRGEW